MWPDVNSQTFQGVPSANCQTSKNYICYQGFLPLLSEKQSSLTSFLLVSQIFIEKLLRENLACKFSLYFKWCLSFIGLAPGEILIKDSSLTIRYYRRLTLHRRSLTQGWSCCFPDLPSLSLQPSSVQMTSTFSPLKETGILL